MIVMKNKLLFVGVAVFVLVMSLSAYYVQDQGDLPRIHQHLVAPAEQEPSDSIAAEDFTTHLPIVEIDVGGQEIPGEVVKGSEEEDDEVRQYTLSETGETTVNGRLRLLNDGQGSNSLQSKAQLNTGITIRYRGNSSRLFDKKSYAIHFINQNGAENPQAVEGMARHDEWVLNGPFLDRTLIRNYLCYNIAGEIMPYAPNARYCEVFLDGEYQGVYLLVEAVARGEGRIEISKPEQNRDMTSWIVRWDRAGKGDHELDDYAFYAGKAGVSALDLRYPGQTLVTPGRQKYVEEEISKIERTLYSCDFDDTQKGYRQYLDTMSFAQYFIINEFFRNMDAGRFSTFYYKDVRGKVGTCIWDFNNACDNYIDYPLDEAYFTMQYAPWFDALVKDQYFVDMVVAEYHRLREGVLSEEYLMDYIDSSVAYLGSAVNRNYQVWGYMFDVNGVDDNYLHPAERNPASYEEAVEKLKNFIVARGRWMDNNIEVLYQYCADSKNAGDLVY